MQTLSAQLKTVKGKKSYGYLPKSVKKTVDEVVDKLEELPEVRECYEQWCALQSEVDSYYHDKPREKKSCPRRKRRSSLISLNLPWLNLIWRSRQNGSKIRICLQLYLCLNIPAVCRI